MRPAHVKCRPARQRAPHGRCLLLSVCCLLIACGGKAPLSSGGPTPGDERGAQPDPGAAPGQCGSQQINADAVPADVLIVLDRSCSMKRKVGGKSKWRIAVEAVKRLLQTQAGKIRFGLSLFPDAAGGRCRQGAPAVPVAPSSGQQISELLDRALDPADENYPNGPCVTNIDTAMKQAASADHLADPERESHVLLITDGKQYGCDAAGGDKGTRQTIAELLASKKVSTFVVGFGAEVDPAQLDVFAKAGGRPATGAKHKFYKAEDETSLGKALSSIAATTLNCVHKLEQVPPTLDKISVYFDAAELPQDPSHQDGWDYDWTANRLSFFGQACQRLEQNQVAAVDIVYGCANRLGAGSGSDGSGSDGSGSDGSGSDGSGSDGSGSDGSGSDGSGSDGSGGDGSGGDGASCTGGAPSCSAATSCPTDYACLQGCCVWNVQ